MSDLKFETLHVKPITYKLDLDDEQMKNLRPFFKVQSGARSKITKTIKHPENKNDDEIVIRKKEKGSVTVELWDGNSARPENLIGRGEVKYDNLSSKEGKHEDWIPLYDRNNKQVGKALVEIDVESAKNMLNYDDMFKMSLGGMDQSFKRALEDMNRTFDQFNHLLPITSGTQQQAIKSEGQQQKDQGTIQMAEDSQRRNRFESTFEDMENMLEKTIEDMHNTFEQLTKDFFPSTFGKLEGEKKMDLEYDKSKQQKGIDQERSRKDNYAQGNKGSIQEEPVKP